MPEDIRRFDQTPLLSGRSLQDIISGKLESEKKESGFFDLPASPVSLCNSPHHIPPSHLHIPQGKGYRHVCPACNKVTEIIPPQYKL